MQHRKIYFSIYLDLLRDTLFPCFKTRPRAQSFIWKLVLPSRAFYSPPLPPLDGILVHCTVTPSSKFIDLYAWVERCSLRVKCLAQEHNAMTRPWLEPGPFNPESNALTIRPPRLSNPHHKPAMKQLGEMKPEQNSGLQRDSNL